MDPFFTVKSLNTTGNFYFFDDKTEKNYYPFKVQIWQDKYFITFYANQKVKTK